MANFKKYSDKILKGGFSLIIILLLIANTFSILTGKELVGIETLVMTTLFLLSYVYSEKVFLSKSNIIPPSFFYISMIFGFFSTFLGSFLNFYEFFEFWDDILHFVSGILLGILCVILVSYIVTQRFGIIQKPLDIFLMVTFGILISISIAVFWEFYEYGFDYIFDGNMQRSIIISDPATFDPSPYMRPSGRFMDPGLLDTMGDFLQAVLGAILGGFYCFIHFSTISKNIKDFNN